MTDPTKHGAPVRDGFDNDLPYTTEEALEHDGV